MAYFAGIDGGGTKTICLVGDEQRVLGRGAAGSAKPARVGVEVAQAALRNAIEAACRAAHIKPQHIQHACIGLAGASVQQTAQSLTAFVAALTNSSVEITGDMVIAHQAAFNGGSGVVVISGTGSICFGRNVAGETARAGGLGAAEGDLGSGEWVGRRAVALGIANVNHPPDFAALCPAIIATAEAGDDAATNLLADAGRELVRLAHEVLTKLWRPQEEVAVSLTGGILQHSSHVRGAFVQFLRQQHPSAQIVLQTAEPALGALALARKSARHGSSTPGHG